MYFSKVFTALLATALTAMVSASPVASDTSSSIVKRTAGNVYVCDSLNWVGTCAVISAANVCNNLDSANDSRWKYAIDSFGPDAGATCTAYSGSWCSGSTWTFTNPGDASGGWATATPWANAIGSIYCNTGTGGGGGGGSSVTGLATYYYPNGQPGACRWTINNGDMAVALKTGDYASGAHCGQSITVHYNGHSISVVVADLCPGCQGTHGIDLTQGAMAALDANYIAHGVDSVTWSF